MIYKGRFVGLEVKAEKGIQSKEQKVFEADVLKASGFYYLVRSIEEAEEALKDIDQKIKDGL